MARLAFALLLGAVAATGFAPLEWWPVTLAAFAALAWLVAGAVSMRQALLIGWLFGLGIFTVGNNWIGAAFRYQDSMPVWLGWFAVPVLSLYLAVFPAVAAGLAWRRGRPRALVFAFTFGAAWVTTEWLRGVMFTGFPWNPLSAIWVPTGALRLAPLMGTYALSGLTALAAALLALGSWRARAITALGIAVPLLWPQPPVRVATGAWVRVVQPNIGNDQAHDVSAARAGLDTLARLTGAPTGEPTLILWPEAALNDAYEIAYDARLREELAGLLGPQDLLVTGATRVEYAKRPSGVGVMEYATGATNSIFVLDAKGAIRGRYDKAHLVPYGEYLPMRSLLTPIGLSRLVPGDIDFHPGPGPQSLELPGFPAMGGQICYEIVFSGAVVDRANRPEFIFNPSNDAWFGSWGSPQFVAQARLRAAEEGLPVIRATPTGISAVIDAFGRVQVALPSNKAGVIRTRMPAPLSPPLFARFGHLLTLFCAILLGGIAVALARRRG